MAPSTRRGAAAYERIIRPAKYRWPEWNERCRTQAAGAIVALEQHDWPEALLKGELTRPGQEIITTACMLRYVATTDPALLEPAPRLRTLSAACEALPTFIATYPPDVAYPKG